MAESKGFPLIALMIFIAGIGLVPFFLFSFSSSVEGQLTAGPELDNVVFTPDDCTAGTIHGFGGVQLTDSTQPGLRVRVIEDELGQMKLAWIREGAAPEVFDAERCDAFAATATFTNTTVNDVRTMQGYARAACSELNGNVTFDGCGP